MKKNLSGLFKAALPVMVCASVLSACQKTFDLEPEEVLVTEQVYQNIYDADAAVLGIYGKFMKLADRYVILNELRGDLVDVTPKANAYLREISLNNLSADNPYADPAPFYEVILNCNDALKNFEIMRDKKLLDQTQFYQRYTDVLFVRTWLYLQLGIHFGQVPYVIDDIADVSALKDRAKFPRISFENLLDNLIAQAESIPDEYLGQNTSLVSPTLLVPMEPYLLRDGVFKFFIHRRSLLGDLHLWKGNYLQAAKYYKDVMETATNLSTTTNYQIDIYDTYRITNDNSGRNTLLTSGTVNPWRNIFSNALEEAETNRERMWTLPFSETFGPVNPFLDLFSTSKSYLLKPSDVSRANWAKQVRTDGGLTDRRGLESSYRLVGGQPEVLKYVSNYDPLKPFKTSGIWLLYRAATLHLRFAEAANREGRSKLASVLINDGLYTGFGNKVASYNGTPDTYPFDFDPTKGTRNGIWYRSIGIRGRALNQNVTVDSTKSFDMSVNPRVLTDQAQLTEDTEELIINEAALETAFEGYRWADLLRIALRREKDKAGEGVKYLNTKLAAKTGNPATFSKVEDFYLPFK